MKTIVIYNSKTGFTKRYAEWISEALSCECVELKEASKKNLSEYDAVVFGGWCMAGGVTKLAWFKNQVPALATAGKKLIVFVVGGSPADSPDIPVAMERIFSGKEWSGVKSFYFPGGFNYEKMSLPSKLAMKMFIKTILAKKDITEDEKKMAEMISHSYDASDKKYIEPILAELKQ